MIGMRAAARRAAGGPAIDLILGWGVIMQRSMPCRPPKGQNFNEIPELCRQASVGIASPAATR
jgi:hypothetical protein